MSKKLTMADLGISFVVPDELKFHDDGFMEPMNFHSYVFHLNMGRDFTLREALSFDFSNEFGGYDAYKKLEAGTEVLHIHIYRNGLIKNLYPLSKFVGGHEETHILKPEFARRYDLL